MASHSLQRSSLFVVLTPNGDLDGEADPASGLYYWDTRVLSAFAVRLRGRQTLTSRKEAADNLAYQHQLGSSPVLLEREWSLAPRELSLRLTLANRSREPFADELRVRAEARFQDIFEVRGLAPLEREISRSIEGPSVTFRYLGRDGVRREIRLNASGNVNVQLEEGDDPSVTPLVIPVRLEPGEELVLQLSAHVSFTPQRATPVLALFQEEREPAPLPWRLSGLNLEDPDESRLVEQARRDLESLMLQLGEERIPAAGLPWFVAIFGRDSLITALEILPHLPELARGTLAILGKLQSRACNPARDAELGKIPHELRVGERANLGHVPFGCYYGTSDATPLFVILLGRYLRETGDETFLASMAESLRAALSWVRRKLQEGGGFVCYRRRARAGLENQGWKDSGDAVRFGDGRTVQGRPVALAEVQGYAYAALQEGARLLAHLGDPEEGRALRREAEALKRRFHREFWLEDEGYFALALAGAEGGIEQVDAITSNPGHGLWSGIIAEERTEAVVERLLAPELFSGYGIRTMASDCAAYDPLSYHNGSVWPHDNALILLGLTQLGFAAEARRVAEGLLEAAHRFDWQLPELFAGFSRDETGAPVPYPDACRPQAWAAGAALVVARTLSAASGGPAERSA